MSNEEAEIPYSDAPIILAIETAQPVETSTIEIVEKLRRFIRVTRALFDELVEPGAMRIKQFLVVSRFNIQFQSTLNLLIEIDQVRI